MLLLTGRAMAQLTRQRILPAQLELDLAAVAAAIVDRLELLITLVNHVRLSVLPQLLLRNLLAIGRFDFLPGHVHGLAVCSLKHLDGRFDGSCYGSTSGCRCNLFECW